MANFWICDSANRILGPLGLGTLRELVASGRVRELSRISRDGPGHGGAPAPRISDLLAGTPGPGWR